MKKILPIIIVFLICIAITACDNRGSEYSKALDYIESSEYENAVELLKSLDDYEDSDQKLKECYYNLGDIALNNEDYDSAAGYFELAADYNDSQDKLTVCQREIGMRENADYAFLDAMAESLMKRYELSEKTDDVEKCVDVELEMIADYKDKSFYDDRLHELAMTYIEGIEIEKQSRSAEKGSQQLEYYKGHAQRFKTLKALTDEYGFLSDNAEYKVAYYNKANTEIERYTALQEIEADLSEQLYDNIMAEYVDDVTARIQIENHTSYDYDMVMYIMIYNSDGVITESDEFYYDDVLAGKKYNLDFYFPANAETFEFYTEEYIEI